MGRRGGQGQGADRARELLVAAPNDDLRAIITAHRERQREQAGKRPSPSLKADGENGASASEQPKKKSPKPKRRLGRGTTASLASLLSLDDAPNKKKSVPETGGERLVLGAHAAYNVFKEEEERLRSRLRDQSRSRSTSRSASPSPPATPTSRRRRSRATNRIYDGAEPPTTEKPLAPDIFEPKPKPKFEPEPEPEEQQPPVGRRGRRASRAGREARNSGDELRQAEGRHAGGDANARGKKKKGEAVKVVAASFAPTGDGDAFGKGRVTFSSSAAYNDGPSRTQAQGEKGATDSTTAEPAEKKARRVYEEYWPGKKVSAGLKSGELLRGRLRINPNRPNDAYVPTDRFARDVYIGGMRGRNRALEGDTVVIRLLPRHQWRIMEREWQSAQKKAAVHIADESAAAKDSNAEGEDPPSQPAAPLLPRTASSAALKHPFGLLSRANSSMSVASGTSSGPAPQTDAVNAAAADAGKARAGGRSRKENDYAHAIVPDEYLQPAGAVVFISERRPNLTFTGYLRPYTPFTSTTVASNSSSDDDRSPHNNARRAPSPLGRGPDDRARRASSQRASPDLRRPSYARAGSAKSRRHRRVSVQGDGTLIDPLMEELLGAFQVARVAEDEPNPHAGKKALFVPLDRRLPRMLVDSEACPSGFFDSPAAYSRMLFSGRLLEWRADSELATGDVAGTLGQSGEIEAETAALLAENDVDPGPFPLDALSCLPPAEWTIPETEVQHRRDYRHTGTRIFSIDPATAKDIDDALHCIENKDGTFEVGVHIADVSYFVPENTALDEVAEARATTVYLVDRAIPMLPARLSEDLCSLNPMADRLAFSVVWRLSARGEILSEWIGRTVIRSCCKLSYDSAQAMLDLPKGPSELWGAPEVEFPHRAEEVMRDVHNLNKLAKSLRKARFDGGSLRLDKTRLAFKLDPMTGLPEAFHPYEIRDSNKLIEEFMLLANMTVAKRIYGSCHGRALLRSHPKPTQRKVDDFVNTCHAAGVHVSGQTAGALQHSLDAFLKSTGDKLAHAALQAMATRPMQTARYLCATQGTPMSEYRHYALNCGLYTHFTSPIRRYADVIVHRLLAASLGIKPAAIEADDVHAIASHCNDRKAAAKRAQEQSEFIFLCVYLSRGGPMHFQAVVTGVMDRSFDVCVPALGIESRVWCDDLPLDEYLWSEEDRELRLVWKPQAHRTAAVKKNLAVPKARPARRDSKQAAVSMRQWRRRNSEMQIDRNALGGLTASALESLAEPGDDSLDSSLVAPLRRATLVHTVSAHTAGEETVTRVRLLAKLKVSVSANMRRIPAEVLVVPVRPDNG